MKKFRNILVILLVVAISVGTVGCAMREGSVDLIDGITPGTVSDNPPGDTSINGMADFSPTAVDLMDGIMPGTVYDSPLDNTFITGMADFSIELFRKSVAEGENSMISPLSVMLALAMTANGADGETLAEFESVLGGGIPINVLSEYLHSYISGLPSSERAMLSIANSIWFRDNDSLRVENGFLQTNADYFGAQIYRAAFDDTTVRDINNWVSENTDEMIDSILDRIEPDHMLFLINAIAFDADWLVPYNEHNIREGDFTEINGNVRSVDFMHSQESIFLDDGMATGFKKFYANREYSFVAMLPNEGVSIQEYIESLTGDGFMDMINSAQDALVLAAMPKFEFEYEISMVDVLGALGMPSAFDEIEADFSKMATSDIGNIFISEVLHKTFISVNELGTRAGAATMVIAAEDSAPALVKTVTLDRPFVFAIIDNATNLPIFIGALLTV